MALKARGSGWDVKLFRSPGDRTEQFILPGLIVQDFAASLTKESPACHWFPSDNSGVWGGKPILSLVENTNLSFSAKPAFQSKAGFQ